MDKKRSKTRWPNVVRYPDGTYYAFVTPLHGGKAKEVSLRTKKASIVPDALKIAEARSQKGNFAGAQIRLKDVMGEYLEKKAKEWKPRTYQTNAQIINANILPFFGRYKLTEIDHNAWDEYVKRHEIKWFYNHRSILTGLLSWAMRKNWLEAMPLVFELPKHTPRPRRILKPKEVLYIVDAATGRLELFIHLILFHGLRGIEATERKFEDVNFEHSYLSIPDAKTGTRSIPLLKYTLKLLEQERSKSTSPYLFAHRDDPNKHADKFWFRKSWLKMLKKAGLVNHDGTTFNITPHDLRATGEKYASKLSNFTATEREKMFGSSVEVQDGIYITEFFVEELRGLESAMIDPEKGVSGLKDLLESKLSGWDKVGRESL